MESPGFRSSFLAAWTLIAHLGYRDKVSQDCLESAAELFPGGAILGFDDRVHIDLDRSHTVLTPEDARQFAAKLMRIADLLDPLPAPEHHE